MSTYDNSPDQTILNTGRFDWETEETLVDRRNRLPNPLPHFSRSTAGRSIN